MLKYPMIILTLEIEQLKQQYQLITQQQKASQSSIQAEKPHGEISVNDEIPVLPIFPCHRYQQYKWLFLTLCAVWGCGIIVLIIMGLLSIIPWLSIFCFFLAYSGLIYLSLLSVRVRLSQLRFNYQNQYQVYQRQSARLNEQEKQISKQKAHKSRAKQNNEQLLSHQLRLKPDNKLQIEQLRLQLKELAFKRIEPIGKSDARVGVSEDKFGQVLRDCFQGEGTVLQGIEFFVEQITLRKGKKSRVVNRIYSADFLLLHHSGLGFDIEIDEPYALLNKQPTHCVDDGKDRQRNQFFVEGGWCVARFTEQQVVTNPLGCCKALATVIRDVTGDNQVLIRLSQVNDLSPVRAWTIQEAKSMAKIDYRLSYLPHSIRQSFLKRDSFINRKSANLRYCTRTRADN